jgi:hypothetical protein
MRTGSLGFFDPTDPIVDTEVPRYFAADPSDAPADPPVPAVQDLW